MSGLPYKAETLSDTPSATGGGAVHSITGGNQPLSVLATA